MAPRQELLIITLFITIVFFSNIFCALEKSSGNFQKSVQNLSQEDFRKNLMITQENFFPEKCSDGIVSCVRRDLTNDLRDILSNDSYNVTNSISIERLDWSESQDKRLSRMQESLLKDAEYPTLIETAIRLFKTHSLVWRMWPGIVHFKVYHHDGEGMDAALEFPGSTNSRTWGGIAARRRITMALLPIMYKMGVGTTLLGVLVFIGLKTMFMVSILFVLAIGSIAKHKLGAGLAYIPVHTPSHHGHLPSKEVHLHVHADSYRKPYGGGGWHRGGPGSSENAIYHPAYPGPVGYPGGHISYQNYESVDEPSGPEGPSADFPMDYYQHAPIFRTHKQWMNLVNNAYPS